MTTAAAPVSTGRVDANLVDLGTASFCARHRVNPALVDRLVALERRPFRRGINGRFETLVREAASSRRGRAAGLAAADGPASQAVRIGAPPAAGSIRLRSVRLRNFSLFAETRLECAFLPGRPVALLEGSNGFGKSTLIEALRFALYGLPPRRLQRLLHRGAKGPDARLEVELQLTTSDEGEVSIRRFADFERGPDA